MNQEIKDALEVLFAAAIGLIVLAVGLVIIDAVWGFEEPSGTCRNADSLKEQPCKWAQ